MNYSEQIPCDATCQFSPSKTSIGKKNCIKMRAENTARRDMRVLRHMLVKNGMQRMEGRSAKSALISLSLKKKNISIQFTFN